MAKRKAWTEAQKQAARDRYARQHQNPKETDEKEVEQAPTPASQQMTPQEDTITSEDYADLLREIRELKKKVWQNETRPESIQLKGGKLIGTVTKYDLDAAVYPDPVSRLAKEPKLARYAFVENYDLKFNVSISEYETIDGIRTKEPKFTLELIGKIFDEETGELTKGRYIICRLIMHEDPGAALVIARDNDLEVDEADEEAFLNEMRYIRMRDWLTKCFVPEIPKKDNRKKEMVIGGKIVEYFEVDDYAENTPEKPFGSLSKQRML